MSERDCPDCDAPMVEETPGDWVCWCCEWMDGGEDPQCDCCGDPLDTDHPELCSDCLDECHEGLLPRPVETVDTGGRL